MKKMFLLSFIFFSLSWAAGAQSLTLTRFAVVDLSRVYTAFFSESQAVREFEERSARIQAEIDRMTTEIQNLRVNLINAQSQGNYEQILRLETEISRRSDFLREYYRTNMEDLERQKSQLTQSGNFLREINDEIRYIAENEGYTMVLNLTGNTGILWYSPTVDITNTLISRLRSRSGR